MQQAKITSIAHEKGGTGKATTTINSGIGLANRSKRVLLIDADASGNLTVGLGAKTGRTARLRWRHCAETRLLNIQRISV